ncbi:MAG: MoxR family ATPase [Kineosporiaceae bacterium]|nr:MoxR family ATPase [Kineosporiaceae bacterium]MBK7624639.1 MoxR family ATPase [Kineosporiaceae bacterium]
MSTPSSAAHLAQGRPIPQQSPTAAAAAPPAGASPVTPGQAHRDMVAVLRAVASVVRGQDQALTTIGCALFSGGHAVIEDRPGSGKTTMAKAFAATVGGDFARVQATADLLPADISGSSMWQGHDVAGGRFVFVPGPLFATVVLVDELNRMPPRTQSAFLEAMDEGAVTVDGVRHRLPEPFFLIATQNPAEHHGTYAVPQAQLDRFAVAVRLAPLSGATELRVIRDQLSGPSVERLGTVIDPAGLWRIQQAVRHVHVADAVLDYGARLAAATRGRQHRAQGAGTRAAISLLRVAQAHALIGGRDHVTPDDIKAVAVDALAHRVGPVDGDDTTASDPHALVRDALARTPIHP